MTMVTMTMMCERVSGSCVHPPRPQPGHGVALAPHDSPTTSPFSSFHLALSECVYNITLKNR